MKRLREGYKHQNKQKQNFFSECDKRREKETQILKTHKSHIVQQTKHELPHDINEKILYELPIGWNLTMMRLIYKLTKRTKTKKYKNFFEKNQYHKLWNYSLKIENIEQRHTFNPRLEAYETSQHFTTAWRNKWQK